MRRRAETRTGAISGSCTRIASCRRRSSGPGSPASTTTYGYLDRQRFLLSLDAGRNPVTGQIQCRSQFDPTARTAFAGSAANLNADIALCVPYLYLRFFAFAS